MNDNEDDVGNGNNELTMGLVIILGLLIMMGLKERVVVSGVSSSFGTHHIAMRRCLPILWFQDGCGGTPPRIDRDLKPRRPSTDCATARASPSDCATARASPSDCATPSPSRSPVGHSGANGGRSGNGSIDSIPDHDYNKQVQNGQDLNGNYSAPSTKTVAAAFSGSHTR